MTHWLSRSQSPQECMSSAVDIIINAFGYPAMRQSINGWSTVLNADREYYGKNKGDQDDKQPKERIRQADDHKEHREEAS